MGGHTTPLPRILRAQSWRPTAPLVALGAGAGAVLEYPRGVAAGALALAHLLPALRLPGRLPQGHLPLAPLPVAAEEAAGAGAGAVLARPRLGRALLSPRGVPRENTHSRFEPCGEPSTYLAPPFSSPERKRIQPLPFFSPPWSLSFSFSVLFWPLSRLPWSYHTAASAMRCGLDGLRE